jgi:ADP-ribose pyrophosphatase YjhB (NUDIX family)
MTYPFLDFAKKIQSIAQIGLMYSNTEFDFERYSELRKISLEMMAALSNTQVEKITELFEHEKGYQTPKVDVRGVVFRGDKILMVHEKTDNCWSLPGGWAEIGLTVKENVIKEIWEETGLTAEPLKILAIIDKKCHAHPASPWYVYKIFILCKETGGSLKASIETFGADFFKKEELPVLSDHRNTKEQINRMFEFLENPNKDIIVD